METLEDCGTDRAGTILKIRPVCLEVVESDLNIYQRTRNGSLATWDQYLPREHDMDIL